MEEGPENNLATPGKTYVMQGKYCKVQSKTVLSIQSEDKTHLGLNSSSIHDWGFPGGAVVKNPPTNAGNIRDAGSIPGSGRPPGVGNGNPFQYSCL